jgi:hypothetical protein
MQHGTCPFERCRIAQNIGLAQSASNRKMVAARQLWTLFQCT